MQRILLPLLLALGATAAIATPGNQSAITSDEIKKHVGYLASDQLEGRGTGTKGERLAGDYMAKQFAAYGLTGGGEDGTFFQTFQVAGRAKVEGKPRLKLNIGGWEREFTSGDFNPFGFSSSGQLNGVELVFAGYGVTDPSQNYDDYAGLDVKGKAVLIIRHEPGAAQGKRTRNSYFTTKAANAKKHGAVAMLIVTGPAMNANDDSLMPTVNGQDSGLFAAHIKQSVVTNLFKLIDKDLLQIQKQIDETKKPITFKLGSLNSEVKINRTGVKARNVIARLEGSDPKLKHEIVVIGAHYDHLGRGNHGGSLGGRNARDLIHNGADDNASGTAGVLEVAQALAKNPPKRTILFMGFSGEERGLLGSRHFVQNPTVKREQIVAMLNMDMIGRLRNDTLQVGGVGTSPGFEALVKKSVEAEGLKGTYSPGGFGPSDHASFYSAKIPVLFFFTGLHADYHRPTDDTNLVNVDGAAKVARIALACTQAIANGERPKYVATGRQRQRLLGAPNRRRGPRGARLGVYPDMTASGDGIAIRQVQPDSPASKGGMRAGDVIVKIGQHAVKDLPTLREALSKHKPKDEVLIKVKRDGKEVSLKVTLGGR